MNHMDKMKLCWNKQFQTLAWWIFFNELYKHKTPSVDISLRNVPHRTKHQWCGGRSCLQQLTWGEKCWIYMFDVLTLCHSSAWKQSVTGGNTLGRFFSSWEVWWSELVVVVSGGSIRLTSLQRCSCWSGAGRRNWSSRFMRRWETPEWLTSGSCWDLQSDKLTSEQLTFVAVNSSCVCCVFRCSALRIESSSPSWL